ncbi:hypothetical protein L1987_80523 [Smallanthus sonchifolius]|uniref:Uncharacterized protein n=1 Tax=Smallanthus sonchifolius TaxID=185202 RepID=A0ACB8YM52_9ASTR|nr:hypothetical protein L1987_80523 [Smallanthus sonchifolius]
MKSYSFFIALNILNISYLSIIFICFFTYPRELGLVKRFWKYLLNREAFISNNSLLSVDALLKQCSFIVKGKGQFKDEFVTVGGVPLSEKRIKSRLFFAGEVLNVDGIT